jgi:hypothetical protein
MQILQKAYVCCHQKENNKCICKEDVSIFVIKTSVLAFLRLFNLNISYVKNRP